MSKAKTGVFLKAASFAIWFSLGFVVFVVFFKLLLAPLWATDDRLWRFAAIALVIAFICVVVVAYILTIQPLAKLDNKEDEKGYAFPAPVTLIVGAWLLVFSLVAIALLLLSISPPASVSSFMKLNFPNSAQLQGPLIMIFAAAAGSSITTILGFLEHASEKRDFSVAYAPWYVARPLMGMLLGLVFYALIRAGLLLTVPPSEHPGTTQLNEWGIAGIGALVGLFSKNAVEKLREVFSTMFSTRKASSDDETA